MEAQPAHAGTTPTERLLFTLCRSSFLQLWSYANVFRDQGKKGAGDGKELCDVLVACGDAVILFSDKSCAFPATGKLEVDWQRWYRRAVEGSRRQLIGAERWIREFPDRVFADRRCTQRLHVTLPPADRMRVFKIAVALGAADRCRAHFGGGSGSLLLMKPEGDGSDVAHEPGTIPFTVPLCLRDGTIVHVVDDITLPVLLKELNTISDFVAYLEAKEMLVGGRASLIVHGEEDLVGLFLGAGAGLPDSVAAYAGDGFESIIVAEGIYADILRRADYRAYVAENQSSYFWDYLITNHTQAVFNGTLVEGSAKTIVENEVVLRILAQEPRVRRRLFADAYLDLMATASQGEITSRTVDLGGDTLYVFQVNPRLDREYAVYRRERQEYLHAYCILAGWRNQKKNRVVGMVTAGGHPMRDGYDVVAIEFYAWPPDMVAMGEELNREMVKDVSKPLKRRKLDAKHLTAWEPDGCVQAAQGVSKAPKNHFKKRKRKRSP